MTAFCSPIRSNKAPSHYRSVRIVVQPQAGWTAHPTRQERMGSRERRSVDSLLKRCSCCRPLVRTPKRRRALSAPVGHPQERVVLSGRIPDQRSTLEPFVSDHSTRNVTTNSRSGDSPVIQGRTYTSRTVPLWAISSTTTRVPGAPGTTVDGGWYRFERTRATESFPLNCQV